LPGWSLLAHGASMSGRAAASDATCSLTRKERVRLLLAQLKDGDADERPRTPQEWSDRIDLGLG